MYFLGHGFGLIPAPGSFAASAFTVPPGMHWFPPIKQPLALGAAASRFQVPQENNVLPELSDDNRICWSRPGAAPSAEQQRLEVHRSFGRHAAVVEERAGRVVLENRVAPRSHLPSAAGGIRRDGGQERLARAR